VKLKNDTWVVVADGAKFLLLRNKGDEDFLDLEVCAHDESEAPAARDLASDRAGRRYDSGQPVPGGVRPFGRSAMEQTDWHRVAEARFAEETAERLNGWAEAGRFRHLGLAADPRTLGALRKAMGDALEQVILAEIPRDLTNLPLEGIERSIKAWEV
jgi:protein required for attachment to host cells